MRAGRDSVQNLFCAGDLDLPFAYRLAQFLKEDAPDVVHCHSRRGADLLGGLAASLPIFPRWFPAGSIIRKCGCWPLCGIGRSEKSSRFRSDRRGSCERGVEDERSRVIRSAVDAEAFAVAPDREACRAEVRPQGRRLYDRSRGSADSAQGASLPAGSCRQSRAQLMRPCGSSYSVMAILTNQLRAQAASLGLGRCRAVCRLSR